MKRAAVSTVVECFLVGGRGLVVVIGGWLLSWWTYCNVVLGFVYGWKVLRLRLNVTSRKLITCLLASMVMRKPLALKMRHISFLMFSVSLGVASVMASPSSR